MAPKKHAKRKSQTGMQLGVPRSPKQGESKTLLSGHASPSNVNSRAGSPPAQGESKANTEIVRTMEELHVAFAKVMDEFRGDKAASRFTAEYEKLYDALRTTHRELRSTELRCAALTSEVKNNTEKLSLAVRLSQEDRALISSLNKQVSDAWSMVDDLHEREARAKEAVNRMQDEIQVLTALVEDGMGLAEFHALAEKSALERKGLEDVVKQLQEEFNTQESRFTDILQKAKTKEQKLELSLKAQINQKDGLIYKAEQDRVRQEEAQQMIFALEKTKVRLTGENKRLENDVEVWKKKLEKMEEVANNSERAKERLASLYESEKKELHIKGREFQELMKKYDLLTKKMADSTINLKLAQEQRTLQLHETEAQRRELQNRQTEIENARNKLENVAKKLVNTQQNLKNCGDSMVMSAAENKTLTNTLKQLEKVLADAKRQAEKDASAIEHKDKNLRVLTEKKIACDDKLTVSMQENARLLGDIDKAYKHVAAVLRDLERTQADKENLAKTVNVMLNEVSELYSELSTQSYLSATLEKCNTQLTRELTVMTKKQMAALGERDAVQEKLTKEEMTNADLLLANHNLIKQTKTLAAEVAIRETANENLTDRLEKTMHVLNRTSVQLLEEKNEKRKVLTTLAQTQAELKNAIRMLDFQTQVIADKNLYITKITSHRNILGATCVNNNEQIAMLMEKNRLLEAVITNGNKMYSVRMQELKYLGLQNTDIWRQKDHVMRKLQSIDNLKHKLGLANDELIRYKARLRALEDEKPFKNHPLNLTKAKDTSKFELILKTNHLMKKLILKTDEVARLETAIIDKDHILNHLKAMLARAPGPEHAVQASNDRHLRQLAERRNKALMAEVNMATWDVKLAQEERDELRDQIVTERKRSSQAAAQCRKKEKDNLKLQSKLKEPGFLPPLPTLKGSSS